MDDLVTGDAVVLDLRLAQLPSRALSISIDIAVQVLALAVLSVIVASAGAGLDDAATQAVVLLVVVGVIVGYPVAFETLSRGRTLGKIALGLRVVRDDGGPERFRQALTRGLFEFVEIWLTFGVIALIASFFSDRGKRVGDQFAGTVVVRERMTAQGDHRAWMRPHLAGWAQSADLSRVPDHLALSARALIARWADLDPASRSRAATALATAMGSYTSPASPPGTLPEDYLAAVLVERRRRAESRLVPPIPQQQWAPPPPAPGNAEPPAPEPPATEAGTGGFSVPR